MGSVHWPFSAFGWLLARHLGVEVWLLGKGLHGGGQACQRRGVVDDLLAFLALGAAHGWVHVVRQAPADGAKQLAEVPVGVK